MKSDTWALSSVGSEHLVYTEGVGGSNPSAPTIKASLIKWGFLIYNLNWFGLHLFAVKQGSLVNYLKRIFLSSKSCFSIDSIIVATVLGLFNSGIKNFWIRTIRGFHKNIFNILLKHLPCNFFPFTGSI